MLRVVGRRLGGRVGKSRGSSLIRPGAAKTATAAASTPTAAAAAAPNSTDGTPSVDVVLPHVSCSALRHVLSSSSPSASASFTAIPDVARVLRLDYTPHNGAADRSGHPLSDVLLVNRIHAAVIADTKRRALTGEAKDKSASEQPLLVLIETNLLAEDAEVQQFILRNALRMHPVPATVEVTGSAEAGAETVRAATPPLTVLVLSAEVTRRVRAQAKLPGASTHAAENSPAGAAATATSVDVPKTQAKGKAKTRAASPSKAAKTVKKAPSTGLPSAASQSKKIKGGRKEHKRQAPPKRAAALLRQRAAAKGKKKSTHSVKKRAKHASAKVKPAPSPPPRLLSADDATEKVLWSSLPGHPLPLSVIAPLISVPVLHKMCMAAAAAAAAPPSSSQRSTTSATTADPSLDVLAIHTVVYHAGTQSSAQSIWSGALQAAAALANALSNGASQLPASVAELVAHNSAALSAAASSRHEQRGSKTGRAANTREVSAPSAASTKESTTPPYVYVLIHTNLSAPDAAVLQRELDYQYAQLQSSPAGKEVAGISLLTTHDVSAARLRYVLEHSVASPSNTGLQKAAAHGDADTPKRSEYAALPRAGVTPEGAEVSRTFQEVYRMLAEVQPDAGISPLPRPQGDGKEKEIKMPAAGGAESSWGAHHPHASYRHPDALVTEAIRVAAITQTLVQRREAQLRDEFAAQQQRNAVSADSEAVARAAQKVEIKTMVTEAVEEVSVRHEQATAHLVKTLSSMVGQWSLEKLSDTLEAIMRDEVKPIMDVLEERLGGAAAAAAAAAAPPPSAPVPPASDNAEALHKAQTAMQKTMKSILTQLQELSERVAALPKESAQANADAQEEQEERWWKQKQEQEQVQGQQQSQQQPSSVADDDRLLQAISDLQKEHQAELQRSLDALKEELQSSPHSAAATTATSSLESNPAIAADAVEAAVSRAVEEVSLAVRDGIQKSVSQQLDSYCEVIREHNAGSHDGDAYSSGLHGASLPVLPVTSFELEEMITRAVNFAVRESTNEVEGHVRTAMEKALRSQATSSSSASGSAASGDDLAEGSSSSSSVKAALEELWAQVKAEAAEEEAVKLSQHNRQLLRLFRRQQHLQRTGSGKTADGASSSAAALTPTENALTLLAVEGAVRSAMLPYMAQMQATLAASAAAAAAAAAQSSSSSSSPDKSE